MRKQIYQHLSLQSRSKKWLLKIDQGSRTQDRTLKVILWLLWLLEIYQGSSFKIEL